MVRAVEEFESTLAIVGGVGLFYYAGSAAYVDGEDILLPIGVKEDTASAEIIGGVNFTQLTKEVRTKTTQTMTDNGFAVIYSASKGQKAADGPPGGNSPFTEQFLNALAYNADELSDLFRRIGQEMAHTTPRQTPFFEDARKVKFYFNKPDGDPRDGVIKILVFELMPGQSLQGNHCRQVTLPTTEQVHRETTALMAHHIPVPGDTQHTF